MQSPQNQDINYALACTPGQDRVFAARMQGLFYSDDLGRSWNYAFRSLVGDLPLPALAVTLSPGFERDRIVLAGTVGGILKSEDGGEHWRINRLESAKTLINGISFSPDYERDGTAFLVTSEDGVYVSSDRGETWTAWNFGLLDANGLCVAVSPDYARDRTVYTGTSSGLFRSTNGGKSWTGVDLPAGQDGVTALLFSGGSLFVGMQSHALYLSADGGRNWVETGAGLENLPVYALLIHEGRMLALAEQQLMLSVNGGASFEPWVTTQAASEMGIHCVACLGDKVLIGAEDQFLIVDG